MAVIFMEGFDHLSVGQVLAAKGWQGGMRFVFTGRFSGQSGKIDNGDTAFKALPGGPYSTLMIGTAFSTSNMNADIYGARSGGTNVVRLRAISSGPNNFCQLINSAGTVLATGTTPIFINTWYYAEIKVVVSATVGTVQLRLNGLSVAECSATGVNTGSLTIDNIGIFGTGATVLIDDMYAVDTSGSAPTNDFLGECRVETLAPLAEGANTAWTANTGTKVSRVNDATSYDSDTGYIMDATPGDRETFTVSPMSVSVGTVYAVQTNLIARKDDAGARTIAPVIRKSGVNYDGATTAGLGASYLDYTQLYDRLDPSGAGWTVATVNAMEAGVKVVG